MPALSFVGGCDRGRVVIYTFIAIAASSFGVDEFADLVFRGVGVFVSSYCVVLCVVVMFDGVFEFALCYDVIYEGEGLFAVCGCASY